VLAHADDCNCEDETTQPGGYILGAWIGWSELSAGNTLADVALATAPEDPRVLYYLYGNATAVDCPRTDGPTAFTPIPWSSGIYEMVDLAATPIEHDESGACSGGVAFIEAALFGISTVDSDGSGTDCDQTGGFLTVLLVAKNTRGETIVECPMVGMVGSGGCSFTLNCATWRLVSSSDGLCAEEGGSTLIMRSYVLSGEGECIPTLDVSVDGTLYSASGSTLDIEHAVDPCSPGQIIDIVTVITYPATSDCDNCSGGTVTEHVTL
jgi:hypothetical protein